MGVADSIDAGARHRSHRDDLASGLPGGRAADPLRRCATARPTPPSGACRPASGARPARPEGPASMLVEPLADGGVRARAWGPGAGISSRRCPASWATDDAPAAFEPRTGLLRDLVRGSRAPLRPHRRVLESLVPAICEQKVTGLEAGDARSASSCSGSASRPPDRVGCGCQPTAERLASLAYHQLHPAGLEQRRADDHPPGGGTRAWLEAAGGHGASGGTRPAAGRSRASGPGRPRRRPARRSATRTR